MFLFHWLAIVGQGSVVAILGKHIDIILNLDFVWQGTSQDIELWSYSKNNDKQYLVLEISDLESDIAVGCRKETFAL